MVALVVWGAVMLGAFAGIWRYKTTPAELTGAAPEIWPADVPIARDPGKATVLMFAHPKCPCTRASIEELAILMTKLEGQAAAHVLFMSPRRADAAFAHTDSWASAARIPDVAVSVDSEGALGARFGATVSGHTVVYDRRGQLVFQGGITPARGHAGDSVGRNRIVGAIQAGDKSRSSAPTFGCELRDREARSGGGS